MDSQNRPSSRVMTGARPTGGLHIGQYFAAFQPFVENSISDDSIFIVSDLHMLTTKFALESTRRLRDAVLGLVAEAIAFGVNPETTSFYLQSQVPWQARIYAIIQSLAPLDHLTNQISFDEMVRHSAASRGPTLGLLGYPVLESSDVISVAPTHVMVGENNLGHFDLMNKILQELRETYGFAYEMPEVITGRKNLVGLDGTEKMSKSAGNAIFLRDSDEQIAQKVRTMQTHGPNDVVVPAEYLEALGASRSQCEKIAAEILATGGVSDSVLDDVTDRAIALISPIRTRAQKLLNAPDYLSALIAIGSERANLLGSASYDKLISAVGIPRFGQGWP